MNGMQSREGWGAVRVVGAMQEGDSNAMEIFVLSINRPFASKHLPLTQRNHSFHTASMAFVCSRRWVRESFVAPLEMADECIVHT
eukprot:scaffold1189_cov182-Alexandrium_tamarense.AAC.3